MHLGCDIGDGRRTYVRHRPDCTVELGVANQVEPDKADIYLTRREGCPHAYDVRPPSEGPKTTSKASTKSYRMGWDRIFGTAPTVGQA